MAENELPRTPDDAIRVYILALALGAVPEAWSAFHHDQIQVGAAFVAAGAILVVLGFYWSRIRGRIKSRWVYVPVLLILLSVFSFYAGYLTGHSSGVVIPPSELDCMSGWGIMRPQPFSGPALWVQANGACVLAVIGNRSDYHVTAVAFHEYGVLDPFDEPLTAKSKPHEIQPFMNIVIPEGPAFLKQSPEPEGGTQYALLVVPKSVSTDQFSTMHEALKLGAHLAGWSKGPPP